MTLLVSKWLVIESVLTKQLASSSATYGIYNWLHQGYNPVIRQLSGITTNSSQMQERVKAPANQYLADPYRQTSCVVPAVSRLFNTPLASRLSFFGKPQGFPLAPKQIINFKRKGFPPPKREFPRENVRGIN